MRSGRSSFVLSRLACGGCFALLLSVSTGCTEDDATDETRTRPVCIVVNFDPDQRGGRVEIGTDVVWNAAAQCTGGAPLYSFRLKDPNGQTSLVRDYSADSSVTWETAGLAAGAYEWEVRVKIATSDEEVQKSQVIELVESEDPNAARPCTDLAVTSTPAELRAGMAAVLQATVAECSNPEYQFWMRAPGATEAVLVQDYGSANGSSYSWQPVAGAYTFEVRARQVGANTDFETSRTIQLTATASGVTCSSVNATPAAGSSTAAGGTVLLDTDPQCSEHLEYKLLVRAAGEDSFSVAQEYGVDDQLAWTTRGEAPGEYELRVLARTKGSDDEFQLVQDLTYTLGAAVEPNECDGRSSCAPALPATTPPRAEFTATWAAANEYVLDASASADDDTPESRLLYRWDFDGNGTWDTRYSPEPIVVRTFAGSATQQVRVQVMDSCGQVAEKTRAVALGQTPTYVSGAVQNTTWSGTVVLTGSVTATNLTIQPGTHVLVTYAPDINGSGTVALTGTLELAGTAEAPIVFSTLGAAGKKPGAWSGITAGSASHVIVEYGKIGLRISSSADNVLVHHSETGINATPGETASRNLARLTNVVSRHNSGAGFEVEWRPVGIQDSEFTSNGGPGLSLINMDAGADGVTPPVERSRITNNRGGGVRYTGLFAGGGGLSVPARNALRLVSTTVHNNRLYGVFADGHSFSTLYQTRITGNDAGIVSSGCNMISAERAEISHNGREAVVIAQQSVCQSQRGFPVPTHYAQLSNMYCNAAQSGPIVVTDVSVAATPTGASWTGPNGALIDYAQVEQPQTNIRLARLYAEADQPLFTDLSPGNHWFFSTPLGSNTLTLASEDATIALTGGVYHSPSAPRAQVLVLYDNSTTLENVYWGANAPIIVDARGPHAVTLGTLSTTPHAITGNL